MDQQHQQLLDEKRIVAINNISDEMRSFYRSRNTGIFLEKTAQKYGIEDADYSVFAFCVGDVILKLAPISKLTDSFINELNIGSETARNITADLIDFLSPVLKEQERKANKITIVAAPDIEGVSNTSETPPESDPQAQKQTVEPTPKETEQPIVEHIRTMEHDMDRIHGYGAYRKLYPEAETTEEPVVTENTPAPNAPTELEKTVHALTQEEMLKRAPLADTPRYNDPNQQL